MKLKLSSLLKDKGNKAKYRENLKKKKFFLSFYKELKDKKPEPPEIDAEHDEEYMNKAKDWFTDKITLETKLLDLGVTEDELEGYYSGTLK